MRTWTQLHGYYLTEASAKDALRRRKDSAYDRATYAPEDRPTYRLRSRAVGPRGETVEGRRLYRGERFWWIERGD